MYLYKAEWDQSAGWSVRLAHRGRAEDHRFPRPRHDNIVTRKTELNSLNEKSDQHLEISDLEVLIDIHSIEPSYSLLQSLYWRQHYAHLARISARYCFQDQTLR